ncbi:LysE family translocator [Rhizobium sp. CECT 9324]|uniref:LysE family translocator n=1 Tax=Rhizobium sp. CECT 9324 TaxID=2845820 RepID=UPI001E613BF6|nr:LysE family translocator [Rhizobium sp. CECT 9324]CAH0343262.1 Leucine efflux protein [Rhizobium sp. CECT 9324]
MTWQDIATFAFATFLLVSSPGPNGALIVKTVSTSGVPAGFANIAGFFSAFWIHGTFSILGLSVIVMQSAMAFAVVKYIGAAYLLWLGLKALYEAAFYRERQGGGTSQPRPKSLKHAYLEGLLTNGLNPKVSMFYLAVFPQFMSHDGGHVLVAAYMLVAIHSTINIAWFSLVILLLSRLRTIALAGGLRRGLKAITGAVFIGFSAKLAAAQSPT